MDTGLTISRLEKDWARKHAKRACEFPEKKRRQKANREQNMLCRVSESRAQHLQRLAAGQQCEADHRASQSKDQRLHCLAAA